MTLVEWLEDFRAIASQFKWKIQVGFDYTSLGGPAPTEQIRGTHKNGLGFCGCPLTCYLYAKQTKVLPDCMFREAAAKCGIEKRTADSIANAADGVSYAEFLRKELLEITELAEEKSVITRATDKVDSNGNYIPATMAERVSGDL